MANINSSMSRNTGLADAVMPEAQKLSKDTAGKGKAGSSFADHLEAPDAKAALANAQKQMAGTSRSSSQASRPAAEKKATAAQTSKSDRSDPPSLDMNPKKNHVVKTTSDKSAKVAAQPNSRDEVRMPSQERADEASDQSRPEVKSAKPNKSQLTGMTKQAVETTDIQAKKEASVLVIQPGDMSGEEQDALESVAFDAKSSEGEPWQKRLEDMLSFMGVPPQALQQELPALAILTGQLQTIEPESIPGALADSALLNNIMASADPEAVVDQVKPLGMWLDDMGWSPDGLVVKDPEAFQELMNTPVSLKDVMKTFEVDVDRVAKEAKILQETLPMEGAAPYIARANHLQADTGRAERKVKGAESDKKTGMSPELLALLNSGAAASIDPQAPPSAARIKDGASKSAKAPEAMKASSIDQLLAAMSSPQATPMEGMPKVNLSSENPFQTMEMTASETFGFHGDSAEALEPKIARGDRQDWLENIQASQIQADNPQAQSLDKSRSFNPEVILDRLAEAAALAVGDSQEGQDSSDNFLADKDLDAPQPTHTQGAHKSENTFDLGTPEAQKAQPAHPVQKALFEKAEMLVKDGGGAIRIDIGNKETGAIDLAVEVKDGKVEVKISAENPEARRLIAQELPRLRESLQNQNLNLSKVEVGLSGGSSWTSSDGRSSHQESSQNAQTEELMGVNGRRGRKTARSYSRVSTTQEMQPGVTREGGGIKVRV